MTRTSPTSSGSGSSGLNDHNLAPENMLHLFRGTKRIPASCPSKKGIWLVVGRANGRTKLGPFSFCISLCSASLPLYTSTSQPKPSDVYTSSSPPPATRTHLGSLPCRPQPRAFISRGGIATIHKYTRYPVRGRSVQYAVLRISALFCSAVPSSTVALFPCSSTTQLLHFNVYSRCKSTLQ